MIFVNLSLVGGIMYRILIVDDEDKIRKGLREYAEFVGFSVEEACDGMEAVNVCKEKDFDVIVMDIMMPRLDGYTACKECLLYTSDAADDLLCVDLGGRR